MTLRLIGALAAAAGASACSLIVDVGDLARDDGGRMDADTVIDGDVDVRPDADADGGENLAADADADADGDGDADGHSDADADADDSGAEAHADADGGVDADGDVVAETDAEAEDDGAAGEADAEVDAETDGCTGTSVVCGTTCCAREGCCGGRCLDTSTDFVNCGSCGNVCNDKVSDGCVGGSCRCGGAAACRARGVFPACVTGGLTGPQLCCASACRDVSASDCGACGNVCSSGTCNGILAPSGDRCIWFCG